MNIVCNCKESLENLQYMRRILVGPRKHSCRRVTTWIRSRSPFSVILGENTRAVISLLTSYRESRGLMYIHAKVASTSAAATCEEHYNPRGNVLNTTGIYPKR